MATERLIIAVNERGARTVKRNIADVGKSATQAEGGVRLLRRALGALATIAILRVFQRTADAFTNIQNRLKLVTASTEELNTVQSELLALSNRTRTSFETNANLFNRFAAATRNLGLTQREVLQFTESLNQAVVVSGASTIEASAALIQLSQGLGAGELRGQELLSVLEQLPFVADVIAKELNTTRASLKRFGEEGLITSEVVTSAFRNSRLEIEELFSQTTPTIAQAFVVLRNEFTIFIGQLAGASGATKGLTDLIIGFATFLRETLLPAIFKFGDSFNIALETARSSFSSIQDLVDVFGINSAEVFSELGRILSSLPIQISSLIKLTTVELVGFFERTETRARLFANTVAGTFNEAFGRDEAVEANIAARFELQAELENEINNIEESRIQILDELIEQENELERRIKARQDANAGDQSLLELTPSGFAPGEGIEELDKQTQKLIKSQQDLFEQLLLQETALIQAAATGEDYSVVLEDMKTNAIGAATAQEGLAFDIIETREELRRLREESERQEFIDNLQLQNTALKEAITSGREFNEVMDEFLIRQQFAADSEGLEEALNLSAANIQLREQLDESEDAFKDFLTRARENSQDILGEALGDVFTGGLDEIPGKFASILADLAAQFFASEIFSALGNLGKGVGEGGGGGGGILGSIISGIGGFFGGNFQGGGQFQVPGSGGPDSIPTLLNLSPRETVTVTPPGQQAMGQMPTPNITVAAPPVVVVDSDEKAQKFLQSSRGEEAVLNILSSNPGPVRSILGG